MRKVGRGKRLTRPGAGLEAEAKDCRAGSNDEPRGRGVAIKPFRHYSPRLPVELKASSVIKGRVRCRAWSVLATMPPRIASIPQRHLRNPKRITIARVGKNAARSANRLYRGARAQRGRIGPNASRLSAPKRGSSLSDSHRDKVMSAFREGDVELLIATDVVCRTCSTTHSAPLEITGFGLRAHSFSARSQKIGEGCTPFLIPTDR